jgi:hypothetical protein
LGTAAEVAAGMHIKSSPGGGMVCLLRPPALAYERFELLLIDTALLALMERSISISFGMYVQNGKTM